MATRMSSSEMQCYAPALDAGSYPLEVSLNEQDYTDHRFPFLYFDDQVIPPCSRGRSVVQNKQHFISTLPSVRASHTVDSIAWPRDSTSIRYHLAR